MATTLLITKADFTPANLVKFSQNIEDDQINPAIYAAQEYDLEPRLGATLYLDCMAVIAGSITRPELLAFVNSKVKRFLILTAYGRFVAGHGLNLTQFGLSKTADPQGTFNQAEAQERAIILRQVKADAEVALIKMTSVNFVFDGVSYQKESGASKQVQTIRAPKRSASRLSQGGLLPLGSNSARPGYALNSLLDDLL